MGLFPKAIFLVTNFRKIKFKIKSKSKSNFSIEFSSKFLKFSRIFPTICVFHPNARKIKAWFAKYIEKYAKSAFLAIF